MEVTSAVIVAISGGLGGAGAASVAFTLVVGGQNKKLAEMREEIAKKVECALCDLLHQKIDERLATGDRKFEKLLDKLDEVAAEHAETNKQLAVAVARFSGHEKE